MSIEIRALNETDAAVFWVLRLRALREDPEAFGSSYEESVSRPMSEVAARLGGSPLGNRMFGAFDGENLVGIVGLIREDYDKGRHRGLVVSMYVAPEARGEGTGRRLMEALIEYAYTLPGLEQIHLAVGSTREAPRSLYLSMGFSVYGTDPRALKVGGKYIDEDLMVLWLARP